MTGTHSRGGRGAARLLPQVVAGIGLLLLGWGMDDLSGFFAHPARAGFIGVALLGLGVALVWRLDVQIYRRGQRPLGRQRWTLRLLTLIGLCLVWFLPYADRRALLIFADADALRYFGLLLYAGGSAVVLVALRALGKQYSGYVTLQEDHQLVQTGIYGVIRHPIYLRALMVSVGLPLIFRSWLALPLMLLAAIFVAVRIRGEERLLAEHFGAEFEAYRRRTWRLIPYLY